MDASNREVLYFIYCRKCVHKYDNEDSKPCCDCLDKWWREGSEKPEFFKEASE